MNHAVKKSDLNNDIQTTDHSALLHGFKLFFVMIGLGFAVCLSGLDNTIIASALPKLVSDFNGLNQISWVAIAYLFAETTLLPIYGKLFNIFGGKMTILFCIFVFELGSLLCAIAQNMTSFIVFRAIAGVGGGGIYVLAEIIVTNIVSAKNVGKYQGAISACYAISTIVGPLLGGIFTDQLTWRWCFFINLPLGAITIIAVIFGLHSTKQTTLFDKILRLDIIGIVIIIVSTICILLSLNWGGNTYAWNSPIIVVLFCVGIVGYTIFGFVESFIAIEPIAPPHLFKRLHIISCFLIGFLQGISFYSFIIYAPIYFQVVKGFSATTSGMALIPYIFGFAAAAALTGQLYSHTNKITYRLVCLIGSVFMIIGFGLITMWNEKTSSIELIGSMVMVGFGAGIIAQALLLCCQESIEQKDIASATSLVLFSVSFGGVFGNAIIGNIFNNNLIRSLNSIILPQNFTVQSIYSVQFLPVRSRDLVIHDYTIALQSAFIIYIPICVLSLILSLLLGNIKRSYDEEIILNPSN
ncbi:major facilitator superfamily domain-containing protein [Gigaspora rosea]|uniref:Major facilitator superfamily domain-containing protein n=1 Tax=Gigaspora rosea TaxID=44941 RepID=A0A397UXG8_9GLOM|nr:major facilitator superfamily domain-containing protein [Gigaspora rosea]